VAIRELAEGMHSIRDVVQGIRQEPPRVAPAGTVPPDQWHLHGVGQHVAHGTSLNMPPAASDFNPGPPVNDTDYLVPHWRDVVHGLNWGAEMGPVPSALQSHTNDFMSLFDMTLPLTPHNPTEAALPTSYADYHAHSAGSTTAEFVEGSSGGGAMRETEDQWENDFSDELPPKDP